MQIALFATIFPILFGTLVGALVGYYGGWPDALFGRVVDAVITFPFLVLVIAIVAVLGPGPDQHVHRRRRGRLGVLCPAAARRDPASRSSRDYAAAGTVMGYGDARIILRHLLPNAITPVARLLDDRHGAGHPARLEPRLSRSRRAAAGGGVGRADRRRQELHDHGWWISIFPGLAIVVTGLGFSLVGDGLAELLRPQAMSAPRPRRATGPLLSSPRAATTLRDGARRGASRSTASTSSVGPGEVLGLVGESGSGKSVTLRSIVRLVRAARHGSKGSVLWQGRDLIAHAGARSCATCAARDRDDLPGADDRAQPGADRPPADRREPEGAHRPRPRASARAARSSCSTWSAFPGGRARSTTIRTSSPAACASA